MSGPWVADRRGVDVGHHLHRVRIAHRQHADVRSAAVDVERPDVERTRAGRDG